MVPLPSGKQAVGSKWVYKIKRSADGNVERHKARLVAQGFTQQYRADYNETFSPVVRLESVRTLIAVSVQRGFKLHHVDVSTAFSTDLYMKKCTRSNQKVSSRKEEMTSYVDSRKASTA